MASTSAHPGFRHGFRNSGYRRGSPSAPPRDGHRHRAILGACRATKRDAEPTRTARQGSVGGWLAIIASPRRRPLRSGARQRPGTPAMLDGAPFGIASGARWDSHCIRPAANTRTWCPRCSPPTWPSIGDRSLRGPVDDVNSTSMSQGYQQAALELSRRCSRHGRGGLPRKSGRIHAIGRIVTGRYQRVRDRSSSPSPA